MEVWDILLSYYINISFSAKMRYFIMYFPESEVGIKVLLLLS